jgi:N-acetylglucosaminyldiphosphoundecaprenol N-acetyl-beta-D-mannosaminyltransferase
VRSSRQAEQGARIEVGTVLGVDYFVGDLDAATEVVLARAASRQGGFSCLAGVHGIIHAQHRPELMGALDAAWLNFADGAPVAWLMRRCGWPAAHRVAGPDLMPAVIDAGQALGIRHYLFGSAPATLDLLEQRLRARYPAAEIAGTMSPPFRALSPEEEDEIAAEIRAAQPHIVWVGLGLPKQDEWMHRNAERMGPVLALGVGAAFDFLAGTKPRAPLWMRSHGLEWLHRLRSEPRRLGYRYLSSNSEFIARAGVEVFRRYPTRVARAIRSLRIVRSA